MKPNERPSKHTSPCLLNFIFSKEALRQFDKVLSAYERMEITAYTRIYYAGEQCCNKIQAPLHAPNYGYDDEDRRYIVVMHDHIAYRYEVIDFVGDGSFGQVIKAIDHATESLVAIKIVPSNSSNTKGAQIEVAMLSHIREADPNDRFGFMRILRSFIFRKHMCIVNELLGMDLYTYLKAEKFRPMQIEQVKQIASRILISLNFMRQQNIIHRDLKPENIVFKSDDSSEVKIIDMGSACFDEKPYYGYIQSRFYRAPEVILGLKSGHPIDMWSFGCILCELANGYPIFSASNSKEHLITIAKFIGPPPLAMLNECADPTITADSQLHLLMGNKTKTHPCSNVDRLASYLSLPPDHDFINFILQVLVWDPAGRATPLEAMHHPWISASPSTH